MSNFRERMIKEFSDLQFKIDKLQDFILTKEFDQLPEIDRSDLKEQFTHMESYCKVLSRRVSRQCN